MLAAARMIVTLPARPTPWLFHAVCHCLNMATVPTSSMKMGAPIQAAIEWHCSLYRLPVDNGLSPEQNQKGKLLEWLQRQFHGSAPQPEFKTPLDPVTGLFCSSVTVVIPHMEDALVFEGGPCRTKKEAEQEAAGEALRHVESTRLFPAAADRGIGDASEGDQSGVMSNALSPEAVPAPLGEDLPAQLVEV